MTDIANVLLERAEPKRDRWGRYLIPGPDGKVRSYTRVTTWAGTVDERHNLEKWQQRQVALGLAARPDLLARVAACQPDDKDELAKLCEQAIEASKGSAGANLGIALHAFTERVDLGEDISIPAPWDADVAAYRATLAAAGVRIVPEYVERVVVNHTLQVAGTFDRLAEVPGLGLTVCDVKTGGFLSFQSIAVQLALYARGEALYDPATETCSPMPAVNQEWGIVIHLPAGKATCELLAVDLRAGWDAAQICGSVRRWRTRKDIARPFDSSDGVAQGRSYLQRRIERLRDVVPEALEVLAAKWPPFTPTLRESTEHTAHELAAIQKVVEEVEAQFELAFVPTDPADGLLALDIEAMIARLRSLPPDLLAVVEAAASQATPRIPNLKSAAARREHLDALEQIVGPAEAQAERRRAQALEVIGLVLDITDDELVSALAAHVTGGERVLERFTDADLVRLNEICSEMSAGRLSFTVVDDEWVLRPRQVAS